jgi:thermostable 8-oxoguanine DNA glycosylase
MIDPYKITNFKRSQEELEEFLLFAIAVAGKNATTTAAALERFLKLSRAKTPFAKVKSMIKRQTLIDNLKTAGIGQYTRISKAYQAVLTLDLKRDPLEKFLAVKGIGPKTARFFLMHSRPNQNLAVIDVHIKRWLLENTDVPASASYEEMEREFLTQAQKRKISPADFDLMLWTQMRDR